MKPFFAPFLLSVRTTLANPNSRTEIINTQPVTVSVSMLVSTPKPDVVELFIRILIPLRRPQLRPLSERCRFRMNEFLPGMESETPTSNRSEESL
jgi:hypothetical protein